MNENHQLSYYPLSSMQSGMLFHSLSAPRSGVEIEQIICTIREQLNLQALSQAWQRVIDRHSVLRTRFAWEGVAEPIQVVEPKVSCPFVYHDWREKTSFERDDSLGEILEADRHRDFVMTEAPLMRVAVYDFGVDGFTCLWTFHHAILDGRSFPTVLSELFACYEAFSDQKHPDIPQPGEYRDYIEWLSKQDTSVAKIYWKKKLKGFTAPTPISFGNLPSNRQHSGGTEAESLCLSKQSTAVLESFVSQHELTLNTVIQGAWSLLLHNYSGEEDVIFGATRAC